MTKEQVFGLIRTILSAIGGVLATKGLIESSMVEPLIGAIVTIGTAVWSYKSKKTSE